MRTAIVDRDAGGIVPLLVAGGNCAYRLSIHQRHYEASLIQVITGRFPAVEWLIGSGPMIVAAGNFVRQQPPMAPCIAEYGEGFPAFLGRRREAGSVRWIAAVGELEWHLGTVATAIAHEPAGIETLARLEDAELETVRLTLQPGLRYMSASWPVDELIEVYLGGAPPEQLAFDPAEVRLEIRGARGAFQISRLSPATFGFRRAIADGRSIGAAAVAALSLDRAFDAGVALGTMFAESLMVAIHSDSNGAGDEHR
jgi:hypothetical protein